MTDAPAVTTEGASAAPVGACPSCGASVPGDGTETRCAACSWKGRVHRFDPPPPRATDQPRTALPDDVVCANHPTKAATAVCAGTGSYICALCAIEIDGETYSADFLATNAAPSATSRFERELKRPDKSQLLVLLVGVFLLWGVSPLILITVVFQYTKHRRLVKENELYREVSSGWLFLLNIAVFSVLSVGVLLFLLIPEVFQ